MGGRSGQCLTPVRPSSKAELEHCESAKHHRRTGLPFNKLRRTLHQAVISNLRDVFIPPLPRWLLGWRLFQISTPTPHLATNYKGKEKENRPNFEMFLLKQLPKWATDACFLFQQAERFIASCGKY